MSRAVVATAYGGPEALSLIEVEVGSPGPGEALLEVRAAGANPVDTKIYSGVRGSDPAQLPMRLGFEAAGVVSAVGDGASGAAGQALSQGDEVIAFRIPGAYADRLVVPAGTLVPKPPSLSFEEAAGLMLTGATAVHALTVTEVGPGETVLIHGASGGVGHMAVQLARITGARVIGTASESNHDFLRELGAEPVTYGEGLVERVRALAPDGVDAAVDAVGGDAVLDASLALVQRRERIATIVPGPRAFEAGIKVLSGAPPGDPGTEIRAAARPRLAELAGEGRLRVTVAATYPLTEVAEVHRRLAAGHTRGKLILIP